MGDLMFGSGRVRLLLGENCWMCECKVWLVVRVDELSSCVYVFVCCEGEKF